MDGYEMKAVDRFDFVVPRNKRHPNHDKYYKNGEFSGAKGVKILLGNIYRNVIDEIKKRPELESLESSDDFIEGYMIWKIVDAIIHEELHRVMYKYIGSKLCVSIDSEIIYKLEDELDGRRI